MQREYRIISELSKNNIRVPKPILLCTDRTVSDDDFYIMEYIEGVTIADNVIAENYSKNDKEEITNSFISTLAELHTFDVKNSKLNDLGKHEDYVLRQLNRWTKQFNAQKVRDITDLDSYRLIISCLLGNPSLNEGEYINGVSVSFLFDQEAMTVPKSANGSPNVQSSQSTIAATKLLFTLTLSNL